MSLADKLKEFETILQDIPPEKQQDKLNELLTTLAPEELEELQKQQCVICGIISGKIPSNTIYNDEFVQAVMEINPASNGHAIVFPKKHHSLLAQVERDTLTQLMLVANSIAQAQYDLLEAEGTNIHVANGGAAGQRLPHVVVNIIPRYENDGIKFEWTYGKPNPDDLKKTADKLRPAINIPKPVEKTVEKVEVIPSDADEEEDDYVPRKIP